MLSRELEGNRGLAKLCGYVFVAVLKWDKCKGFYILERKTKSIRLKIWKRVKKKIYEPVMVHSTLNIKGCIQSGSLGPE